MINVRLPRDLVVALPDLVLRVLVLTAQLLVGVTGLCQLDLDVPERVLELLVFHFGKAEHLSAFFLRALVSLHSEALARVDGGVLVIEEVGPRIRVVLWVTTRVVLAIHFVMNYLNNVS